MAKYTRMDIDALCNRLEAVAASMFFASQPNLKGICDQPRRCFDT
jgi:hypothetical protein